MIKLENLNGTLEKETKKISFELSTKGTYDFDLIEQNHPFKQLLAEKPTEEEKSELANTLQMLQPNKSEVNKDENLVEILEIDTKEDTENEETSTKDNEVKLSSETASDNLGETEVKKAPDGEKKCSSLPRDDPILSDDHKEIMNKANTLRTLSKVLNSCESIW